MIYINNTSIDGITGMMNFSSTPADYVYVNNSLIWARMASNTIYAESSWTTSITYYGSQPTASDSTTTKTLSSGINNTVDARINTTINVNMSCPYCYYPGTYTSATPSNWKAYSGSGTSFFGTMFNQNTTPKFNYKLQVGEDGNNFSPTKLLYRCKPYYGKGSSTNITDFYIYNSNKSASLNVPNSTSNSTSWKTLSDGTINIYGLAVGPETEITKKYIQWYCQSEYYYDWIWSSSYESNASNLKVAYKCGLGITVNSPYHYLGTLTSVNMKFLSIKNTSGSTYRITNNLPFPVNMVYNTKKCIWNDGINWTNLGDVSSTYRLAANGGYKDVTISSNWFADAETCAIVAPNGYRYISCLGSDGYTSTNAIKI